MDLQTVVDNTLSHVRLYLGILGEERYRQPLEVFSGSSIGQHTRHIIEFLDCLIRQCESVGIDYDHRLRNKGIEDRSELVLDALDTILSELGMHDLRLRLTLIHL